MPSSSLHSRLHDLASTFADAVLSAIRTASLDDLTDGHAGNGRRGRSRAQVADGGEIPIPFAGKPKTAKGGRLARRSAEDIEKTLGLVVAALKGTKGKGMRAEDIRSTLGIERRELPRVLAEGLRTKQIRKSGRKRATTYGVR